MTFTSFRTATRGWLTLFKDGEVVATVDVARAWAKAHPDCEVSDIPARLLTGDRSVVMTLPDMAEVIENVYCRVEARVMPPIPLPGAPKSEVVTLQQAVTTIGFKILVAAQIDDAHERGHITTAHADAARCHLYRSFGPEALQDPYYAVMNSHLPPNRSWHSILQTALIQFRKTHRVQWGIGQKGYAIVPKEVQK